MLRGCLSEDNAEWLGTLIEQEPIVEDFEMLGPRPAIFAKIQLRHEKRMQQRRRRRRCAGAMMQ